MSIISKKKQILTESLFTIKQIDNLDYKAIYRALNLYKFVCIRGLIQPQKVKQAKQAIVENFKRMNDHPGVGESPNDVKTNFQKLIVGSFHRSGYLGGRLLRTFYNPLWEADIYKMHDIFRIMIKVRNRLLNKPDNWAGDVPEDGVWTAARIHQYPSGGGFMSAHKDKITTHVVEELNLNYYQLLLIMNQKGIDFEKGGGFIEHEGERIIFEDEFQLGDIVIYDSQTIHGVEDIDPQKNLDLDTICGRMSAFVTLYKSL